MRAHVNSRWRRIAGFTLIEMLVVLAILALAATFAVPMLSSGSEGVRLDVAAGELTNALRVTRSAAITSNRPTVLTIDVNRRRFKSSVVAERTFDAGIDAKLTFAAGIGSRGSEGEFRFFPDGSSTGGDVTLSMRGKQTKLCVDWLTGTVRAASAC
ncbi:MULTISPECIES: GspH/FimT family pseudopilin [unclassified Bradyrhizobium]|uniref:GspH/FimT family pseudopilin n=1 Tax=unclassified Bradyrhizobium TaxID=2631580 RepID=UPI001BAE1CC3|nr:MULTISPECIES: GspH/FimT family pseudopilin [unclassified Bradyrhizobium]MBR1201853.1 GspH/FimT family pseudopilin [Bradyrhizobium sp. AUGA SZCCT0124]MBR1311578.1 GspH/FimT family pseudopilin [Bradyrhizobium sp. AUGA SZCCT0051]MBR1338802.1 GspH/FimT family pseudopilin [Bradyrhizobium sp. AUGA SZCCT0105]MBR1353376.1 GspH/FimT family pseudopilin [Bradyrhizobium sp. AUGA SZCCT0045]